jgi:hypothetical protein
VRVGGRVSGRRVGGRWRRREEDEEVVDCSDEEITHNVYWFMICDVHFGDTRND